VVTARAVAPLPVLLEYTAPLARDGGLLALPKGSGVSGEIAAAADAQRLLGLGDPGLVAFRAEVSGHITAVLYRRKGPLPNRYPRRPGAATKRPLGGKEQGNPGFA
jgi:16S rRNA (guanine527-N7)-methyltransferase